MVVNQGFGEASGYTVNETVNGRNYPVVLRHNPGVLADYLVRILGFSEVVALDDFERLWGREEGLRRHQLRAGEDWA
jgi:hypothetical protein